MRVTEGLALEIASNYPELMTTRNSRAVTPLQLLVTIPDAFRSNLVLGPVDALIYQCEHPLLLLHFRLTPADHQIYCLAKKQHRKLDSLCIVYLLVLKLSGIPLEDSVPSHTIHKGDLEKQVIAENSHHSNQV